MQFVLGPNAAVIQAVAPNSTCANTSNPKSTACQAIYLVALAMSRRLPQDDPAAASCDFGK